jgi:hypothetical protein
MSSHQLNSKLEQAVAVIAKCEAAMADPGKATRKGYAQDARCAVFDFMDRHRDELREGGAA